MSASMVRDALTKNASVEEIAELVGDDIAEDVISAFHSSWGIFTKT
ncbi:hypothetical protein IPM19_01145 [bacterium]|nr:MAG: hypothetical protein IPM19_01145 [bacterium]